MAHEVPGLAAYGKFRLRQRYDTYLFLVSYPDVLRTLTLNQGLLRVRRTSGIKPLRVFIFFAT